VAVTTDTLAISVEIDVKDAIKQSTIFNKQMLEMQKVINSIDTDAISKEIEILNKSMENLTKTTQNVSQLKGNLKNVEQINTSNSVAQIDNLNKIAGKAISIFDVFSITLGVAATASLVLLAKTGQLGRGFIQNLENLSLFSSGLGGLGAFLGLLGGQTNIFVGNLLQSFSLLSTGITIAISLLSRVLGGYIQGVGQDLLANVEENELSFLKLEKSINQFSFTIVAFGKAVGENVIGSLQDC